MESKMGDRSSKRADKYTHNFALKSSSLAMALLEESLGMDIVELWRFEDKEYICVFIHASDSIVEARDEVIVSNAYFPSASSRKHVISPKICDRLRQHDDGYYWNSVSESSDGKSSELGECKHPDHVTPWKTVMGFTFLANDNISADSKEEIQFQRTGSLKFIPAYEEYFIIGFSSRVVAFTPTKLYFLSGVCYTIMAILRDVTVDKNPEQCPESMEDDLYHSNISSHLIESKDLNKTPSSYMQRGLTATLNVMKLITTTLMMDLVQLWKVDKQSNDYVLVYAYVADSTLRWDPDVIYTFNYYPSDGSRNEKSPQLCEIAKRTSGGLYWNINSIPITQKTPLLCRTEFSYKLDCPGEESFDVFVVGLSRMGVPITSSKVQILSGLSYSLYVAAHDAMHPELATPKAGPQEDVLSRPSSLDRDDPHLALSFIDHPIPARRVRSTKGPSEDSSSYLYPIELLPRRSKTVDLDDIKNLRHLAEGCHSSVYSGYLDGERVAVKFIREDCLEDHVALNEFAAEEQILSRTNHPNVIKLIGTGSNPRTFLVFEWLGGGILGSILSANKLRPNAMKMFHRNTFSFNKVLTRALEFASAMRYLHSEVAEDVTIIHRDLKPDNIGFSATGELKVADFGMSICVLRRRSLDQTYAMSGNTGSLRYMAPEVASNEKYSETVDVYSYGIILWQMATDMVPFADLRTANFHDEVVVKRLRPKINTKSWPPAFCSLLESCWDPIPTRRPTFSEICNSLQVLILGIGNKPESFMANLVKRNSARFK